VPSPPGGQKAEETPAHGGAGTSEAAAQESRRSQAPERVAPASQQSTAPSKGRATSRDGDLGREADPKRPVTSTPSLAPQVASPGPIPVRRRNKVLNITVPPASAGAPSEPARGGSARKRQCDGGAESEGAKRKKRDQERRGERKRTGDGESDDESDGESESKDENLPIARRHWLKKSTTVHADALSSEPTSPSLSPSEKSHPWAQATAQSDTTSDAPSSRRRVGRVMQPRPRGSPRAGSEDSRKTPEVPRRSPREETPQQARPQKTRRTGEAADSRSVGAEEQQSRVLPRKRGRPKTLPKAASEQLKERRQSAAAGTQEASWKAEWRYIPRKNIQRSDQRRLWRTKMAEAAPREGTFAWYYSSKSKQNYYRGPYRSKEAADADLQQAKEAEAAGNMDSPLVNPPRRDTSVASPSRPKRVLLKASCRGPGPGSGPGANSVLFDGECSIVFSCSRDVGLPLLEAKLLNSMVWDDTQEWDGEGPVRHLDAIVSMATHGKNITIVGIPQELVKQGWALVEEQLPRGEVLWDPSFHGLADATAVLLPRRGFGQDILIIENELETSARDFFALLVISWE